MISQKQGRELQAVIRLQCHYAAPAVAKLLAEMATKAPDVTGSEAEVLLLLRSLLRGAV